MAPGPALQVGLVRVDDVDFHPLNRKDLGDLRPLAASISRNGLIHPIVVERRGPRFRLRAGARRLQAARMAGLVKVPAMIHTEALDDRAWLVHMAEENSHRAGLPFEERRALILKLRNLGVQWIGIAAAFGVHPTTARAWLQGTDTLPGEPVDSRDPMGAPDDGAAPPTAKSTPPPTPGPRRAPRTIAIARLADVVEDLTTRARDGALTVDDCLTVLHELLDAAAAPKGPTQP